jgi:hypothetical protein
MYLPNKSVLQGTNKWAADSSTGTSATTWLAVYYISHLGFTSVLNYIYVTTLYILMTN